MKTTIHNPIPWSILSTPTGTHIVTITAGPREAVQLIFPSRVAFGVFADILQSAAASMIQHTGVKPPTRWESQALQAIHKVPHNTGAVSLNPEDLSSSALRAAGFVETPGEGWDFHREALNQFSFPSRTQAKAIISNPVQTKTEKGNQ